MNILDASFNHSVFSKNKERLLEADVSGEFFREIVDQARDRGLLSDEHFSVDGTLLEAWALMKSFRPNGEGSPPPGDGGRIRAVDFRGERRVNETHESRTDPGARLARRGSGKEARLCYEGHVLMDNRQGLVVDVKITEATGTAVVACAPPWPVRRSRRWWNLGQWSAAPSPGPAPACQARASNSRLTRSS